MVPCSAQCPLNQIIELIALAVVAHMNQCVQQAPDKLISPTEAAALLNTSRRSLDRQHKKYPYSQFCRDRPSGHGYTVVLSKLQRFLSES